MRPSTTVTKWVSSLRARLHAWRAAWLALLTQHLTAWLILSGILPAVMHLVAPQPGSLDAHLIKLG